MGVLPRLIRLIDQYALPGTNCKECTNRKVLKKQKIENTAKFCDRITVLCGDRENVSLPGPVCLHCQQTWFWLKLACAG